MASVMLFSGVGLAALGLSLKSPSECKNRGGAAAGSLPQHLCSIDPAPLDADCYGIAAID